MTLSFSQKIRNNVSTPIGHALLLKRTDDAYIVAFPRSGSTWLRTILVNILEPSAKSNPDVFNARIPAVSIRNASIINQLTSPRLIMTHSIFRASINKALYLVRDGRDSFISSYHYHVTREGIELSLDDYYKGYINGLYGQTWEEHVQSWMQEGQKKLGKKFMLLNFEALKMDTFVCVKNVCRYLEISVTDERIKKAIEAASLNKVKEIERSRQGEIQDNNASFYRSGAIAQWQNPEYAKVIKIFEGNAKKSLTLTAYL